MDAIREAVKQNIDDALGFLVKAAKEELREQGHRLTGSLERSFEIKFMESADTIKAQILQLDYGIDLDTGIPANKINPNDPTYLKGLTDFFRRRTNLTGSELKGRVRATALKASKIGHPTKPYYGGKVYSKNGRRTGWTKIAYSEDNISKMEKLIAFDSFIESIVNSAFQEVTA